MKSYRRRRGVCSAIRALPGMELPEAIDAISDFTDTGLVVRTDTGLLEVPYGDFLLIDEAGAFRTYQFEEFNARFIELEYTPEIEREV